MKSLLFLALIYWSTLSFAQTKVQKPMQLSLNNENWIVRQVNESQTYPAKVPGCIQTDLYKNGVIENPLLDTNEQKYKWIEVKDWEYSCIFLAEKNWFKYEVIELNFDGIDTYSDVYLNDTLILKTENMFLSYTVDVKSILKSGNNRLKVNIKSPTKTALPLLQATKYRLPAGNDRNDFQTSVFTRKAPYQYGWDWGPRIVTMGVWKPISIELKNAEAINTVYITTDSITKDYAIISIVPSYKIPYESGYYLELKFENYFQRIALNPTKDLFPIKVKIANPKLWYPNGYGSQPLYNLEVALKKKDLTLDEKAVKFGIRTIELVQNKDSIGQSFYFVVNGIPVFAKGANYIPQDNFPNEVDTNRYNKMIQLAKDGNMNMLRIWGGGYYENDYFYEMCDELGILVWQDFMFACSLYPENDDFLESVKEEAKQNILRLRNHPSLALWCGNNEMNELWYNWGYQKAYNYSAKDSIEIWNNYLKVFHEILPQVLKNYDSKRPYISSSPLYGWGHDESMKYGDSHYWGVWWGKEPFKMYAKKVPRFSSEYGFQSLPQRSTIQAMGSQEITFVNDFALQNHQKHSEGFQIIKQYISDEYMYSDSLEELIYLSQITQAQGIGIAIKAHRSARNYCMGTLFWQLNDCWPSVSWSCIDYFYNPKPLYYESKRLFKTFMLNTSYIDSLYQLTIVSDTVSIVNALLTTTLYSMSGEILYSFANETEVPSLSSTTFYNEKLNSILNKSDKQSIYLVTEISLGDDILAKQITFFAKSKNLKLPKTTVETSYRIENQELILKITSQNLVKDIVVSTEMNGFWSDNYFSLIPGESKEIKFTKSNYSDKFKTISIFYLNSEGIKKSTINVTN